MHSIYPVQEEKTPDMPVKPILGMVAALSSEGRRLLGRKGWRHDHGFIIQRSMADDQTPLLAMISGMGLDNALCAARRLIGQGAGALVSIGVSGGLDPGISSGGLVAADRFLHLDGGVFQEICHPHAKGSARAVKTLSAARFSVRNGAVITAQGPALSAASKSALHRQSAALAVDMESAAVAKAAAEANIPVFALRVVCDPAAQSIPPDVFACLLPNGRIRYPALIRAISRKPALMIHLVRMGRQYHLSLQILQDAWRTLARSGFPAYLIRSSQARSNVNGQ